MCVLPVDEDGKLTCNEFVESETTFGDNTVITIKYRDQKFASNIQETIRNAVKAALSVTTI